jgi:hypothetical protein
MFRGNDTNLAESSMFQPRKAGIGTCAELYVERLNWSDRTPSMPCRGKACDGLNAAQARAPKPCP